MKKETRYKYLHIYLVPESFNNNINHLEEHRITKFATNYNKMTKKGKNFPFTS